MSDPQVEETKVKKIPCEVYEKMVNHASFFFLTGVDSARSIVHPLFNRVINVVSDILSLVDQSVIHKVIP